MDENGNTQDYNTTKNPEQNHEDTKQVVDTAAKGVSEYFAPGVGAKAYDTLKKVPGVGNNIDSAVSDVAGRIDQIPGVRGLSKGLNESGATSAINGGIDALSGSNSGLPNTNGLSNANGLPNTNGLSSPGNVASPNSSSTNNIGAKNTASASNLGVPSMMPGMKNRFSRGTANTPAQTNNETVEPRRKNFAFNESLRGASEELDSEEISSDSVDTEDSTTTLSAPENIEENNDTNNTNNNKNTNEKKQEGNSTADFLLKNVNRNVMFLFLGGGIIFFFLLIILIAVLGGQIEFSQNNNTTAINDANCNINDINVNIVNCYDNAKDKEELESVSLEDYILGATFAYTKGNEYNDEALKAMMIVLKTNALSYGNYTTSTKNIELKSCSINSNYCNIKNGCYTEEEGFYDGVLTYKTSIDVSSATSTLNATDAYKEKLEEIYNDISGFLYVSNSYKSINSLNNSNVLPFDENILREMESLASSNDYTNILNAIYNSEDASSINDSETEVTNTRENLFVGDSRMSFFNGFGLTSDNNAIYGGSQRYAWFVGSTVAPADKSNYPEGGIKGINSLMKENTSYNIIIWMGTNDPNAYNDYFNKYKELAEGEWASHELYIVSVGPVKDSVSRFVKNNEIEKFNQEMESLISSSNISNLHYIDLNYKESDIIEFDTEGVHYPDKEDNENIYNIIINNIGNTKSSKKAIYNFRKSCSRVISNGACRTDTDEANLSTFVGTMEGMAGEECTVNGLPGKIAAHYSDGTITAGPGITTWAISDANKFIIDNNYTGYFRYGTSSTTNRVEYNMEAGDCIPDKVLNEVKIYELVEGTHAQSVDSGVAMVSGVSLTPFQRDALISFCYNVSGCDKNMIAKIVTAYKDNGYEGLWNSIKDYVSYGTEYTKGLKSRRKAEFRLFVLGDYVYKEDYDANYDYYDSQNIVANANTCKSEDGLVANADGYIARTTRPLRDNKYYYAQDATNYGIGLEGECPWYATGRAKEILATMGDGRTWETRVDGGDYCSKPQEVTSGKFKISTNINDARPGAIISWSGGPMGFGHVAIVEAVHADGTMSISQGGMGYRQNTAVDFVHTSEGRKYACEMGNTGCFNYTETKPIGYYGNGYTFNCYIYLLD